MSFIFEDHDIIYVDTSDRLKSVMYFNGAIYHNATATSSEIIDELNTLLLDKDILARQAALMSLIHMKMDGIKEKYCS